MPGWVRVVDPRTRGRVAAVTQTTEPTVITEALSVIDRSLAQLAARELVSSTEMSDLLLDLRLLLMASDPGPVDEPVGEGAPA
jgi:hypothetical protein